MRWKPRRDFLSGPSRLSVTEARNRIQNALLLAGLSMVAALPLFYDDLERLSPRLLSAPVSPKQILPLAVGQSLVTFGLAFICSLVGFLYAHRLSLPGLGLEASWKRWTLIAIAAGLLLIPPAYFGLERRQLVELPELFPASWPRAVAVMAGGAIVPEVIVRFGLLTICVYLLRWAGFKGHPWPATVIISLFMLLGQYLRLEHFHLLGFFTPLELGLFLGSIFLFQVILSETYLRRGLLPTMILHAGMGLRLVFYALFPP